MKTTFISTLSVSNSMQQTVSNSMTQITKLQEEAVTGVFADTGLELGARTSTSVDYSRESSRLQSIIDSNSMAETRMDSSQLALENIADSAQTLLDSIIALSGNTDDSSLKVASQTASSVLENFFSYANSSTNGEYIFSGIKTDQQTLDDTFVDDISADVDTALSNYMTLNGIADVADITGAQMQDFMDSYEASFDWSSWTNASATEMTTSISTSETVVTSSSAQNDGFKNLVLASVFAAQLSNVGLSDDALGVLNDNTASLAGEAITGLNSEQSSLGLSQSRVEQANTYLSSQITILDTQLSDLVGVDAEEASVNLTTLLTQVETSYTITSKILDLSLVNFI